MHSDSGKPKSAADHQDALCCSSGALFLVIARAKSDNPIKLGIEFAQERKPGHAIQASVNLPPSCMLEANGAADTVKI